MSNPSPSIMQDLEWDNDDESFKSAVEFSLAQSFLAYSTSIDPDSHPIKSIGTASCHSDFFVDALSEEESGDDFDDELWWKTESEDFAEDTKTTEGNGNGLNRTSLSTPPVDLSRATATAGGAGKAHDDDGSSQQEESITSYAFNQDRDCIVLSTTAGYQIQTLEVDPNECCQIHKVPIADGGVSHIQILHRTSLLAIVKRKTPRLLSIIHARTALLVKELSFTSAVRRVEMNKIALMVLTASGELHCFVFQRGDVHFVRTIPILHESESARMFTAEAAATQGAFFELAPQCLQDGHESWVVTKSAEGLGFVAVYKICDGTATSIGDNTGDNDGNGAPSMELVTTFCAHNHSIARVAIGRMGNSSDEYVLATASMQGTIIRVFSLPQCQKIYELQRGSAAAAIFSLSFNSDSSVLAVSSSKGTVHMFHLCEENRFDKEDRRSEPAASASASSRTIFSRIVGPFRPNAKDDGKQQPFRSFAKIRIKDVKARTPNSIALLKTTTSSCDDDTDSSEDNLVIFFGNGRLFHFAIPRKKGKSRPVRAEDLLKKECDDVRR